VPCFTTTEFMKLHNCSQTALVQAGMTLVDVISQLNKSTGTIVDLHGWSIDCAEGVDPAALCVITSGGTLRNGTVRIPAGYGIHVDEYCTFTLEGIRMEAVSPATPICGGVGGVGADGEHLAMLSVAVHGVVTVSAVQLEGAVTVACRVASGATLTGTDLTINGATECALLVDGGVARLERLRVVDGASVGVKCLNSGSVSGGHWWLRDNCSVALLLETAGAADMSCSSVECCNGSVGCRVHGAAELVCNDVTWTGAAGSVGVFATSANASVNVTHCRLRRHACAVKLEGGAHLVGRECSIQESGTQGCGDAGALVLATSLWPAAVAGNKATS
jgi:hypothetical protein